MTAGKTFWAPKRAGLWRNRSGSAALIFGLAFVPAMLTIGAAIDYSRMAYVRSKLQAATDEAALAAGSQPKRTQAERQAIATNKVLANLGSMASQLSVTVVETEPKAGVYRVNATAVLNNAIMKIANMPTATVSANTEASLTMGSEAPVEMALALDNTGSMRNDMAALKDAAKTLVNNAMGNGGGKLRISVVPYVAAVNPGLTDLSMVDTGASAPMTGLWFSWPWIAQDANCVPNWGGGGGGSSGPGGGSSGDTAGDARDFMNLIDPFRKIAGEFFGVSPAFAAGALASGVTANTIPPLIVQNQKSSASGRTFGIPAGFSLVPRSSGTGGCDWLGGPGKVSHYELFQRTLGQNGAPVRWKGCVEARASAIETSNFWWGAGEDLDVTDTPPVAGNAASLFTPYFWPDEPDYNWQSLSAATPGPFVVGTTTFHNNYLKDFAFPTSWNWKTKMWESSRNILKYDGTTRAAIIKETAPDTYGPNAACPEPLTRLTNSKGQVISAIEAMNFWYNGGTVISEGLTWAWRTLSPEKPFADGAPYSDKTTRKVIVLMTDGVNGLAENGNASAASISDYSAYGYLGGRRFSQGNSVTTYAGLQTFLDNRLKKACENAKAKGVTIYTVMFNHNGFLSADQQAHSAALLSNCASKPENAFVATNSKALTDAFSNISVSATATPLRITR